MNPCSIYALLVFFAVGTIVPACVKTTPAPASDSGSNQRFIDGSNAFRGDADSTPDRGDGLTTPPDGAPDQGDGPTTPPDGAPDQGDGPTAPPDLAPPVKFTWRDHYDELSPANLSEGRCVSDVVGKLNAMIRHPDPIAVNGKLSNVPAQPGANPDGKLHWQGIARHPDHNQVFNPQYEYFYLSRSGDAQLEGGLYRFKIKPHWDYNSSYTHQTTRTNLWQRGVSPAQTIAPAESHFFDSSPDYHLRSRTDSARYCPAGSGCGFCDHFSGISMTTSLLAVPAGSCTTPGGAALPGGILSLFDVSPARGHKLALLATLPVSTEIQSIGIISDGSHQGATRFLAITVETATSGSAFDAVRLWQFSSDGTVLGKTEQWSTGAGSPVASTFSSIGGSRGENSISLIRECGTHKVFAVGTSRSDKDNAANTNSWSDMVTVWQVNEPTLDVNGNINHNLPWGGLKQNILNGGPLRTQYWCTSQNTGNEQFCQFGKAGSVYVSSSGDPILYAGETHASHPAHPGYDYAVRLAEFPYSRVRQDEAWITLYDGAAFDQDPTATGFNRSALTLTATQYFRNLEDYDRLWDMNPAGGDLNNKASSAIVSLPSGCYVTVWADGGPAGGASQAFSVPGVNAYSTLLVDNAVSAVTFGPDAATCAAREGP